MNKETVAETALDSEYEACYLRLDELSLVQHRAHDARAGDSALRPA